MVSIDPSVLETLAAKAPPHHREAEEAVLGSLLQDRNVLTDVVDLLDVDDFYVVSHQIVFRAILDLFERGSGVDVTIVAPDFVVSEIHRRAIGPDGRPLGHTPMQESRIMGAQQCAQLIAGAMRRRDRMLITSLRGRLGRWARLIAPELVDDIAARAIRERR